MRSLSSSLANQPLTPTREVDSRSRIFVPQKGRSRPSVSAPQTSRERKWAHPPHRRANHDFLSTPGGGGREARVRLFTNSLTVGASGGVTAGRPSRRCGRAWVWRRSEWSRNRICPNFYSRAHDHPPPSACALSRRAWCRNTARRDQRGTRWVTGGPALIAHQCSHLVLRNT